MHFRYVCKNNFLSHFCFATNLHPQDLLSIFPSLLFLAVASSAIGQAFEDNAEELHKDLSNKLNNYYAGTGNTIDCTHGPDLVLGGAIDDNMETDQDDLWQATD